MMFSVIRFPLAGAEFYPRLSVIYLIDKFGKCDFLQSWIIRI